MSYTFNRRKDFQMFSQKFNIYGLCAGVVSLFLAGNAYAASISGTVTYQGDVPQFKEIKMDADPVCLTHHTTAVYPETLLLGEGGTMGNVFVQVVSGFPKKDYPVPSDPVVIDQKGCTYTPHVVGVRAGQTVKILNPDGTLHNVHALSKVNPEFNLAMPKFRTETEKVFEKPEGMFPIKCDVHPWMGAWISVLDHPFFAVTQKDGKFEISGLEPGTYEIEVWHEKLGTQKSTVTIGAADEKQEANFSFSKP